MSANFYNILHLVKSGVISKNKTSKLLQVVKLHTQLGKPIPTSEPVVIKKEPKIVPASPSSQIAQVAAPESDPTDMDTVEPDIEPVGMDYIEEIKTDDGSFF